MRLHKFLADCGIASRRKSELLMQSGKVTVNGSVASEPGTTVDPDHDVVCVKGQRVRAAHKGLLLLHKPDGVLTSVGDPHGRRTVSDLVSKQYRSYFPVGRLDWDSTGLVIMTNDGELADRLLHPRFGFDRVYEVTVDGIMPQRAFDKIERGVMLEDGEVHARAELLEHDDRTTTVRMTLRIGRNRIIRRLMDRLGFPVVRLHRIQHGPLRLGSLKPGEIRKLSEREYRELRGKILRGR